ncbi:hypothetical protein [Streptomyces sp. NPDC059828]|uniref:hypothetical protein n=1 Tax=Streptomyces sp. NPDC059828 TaxID=3346965 RepID=UPI0036607098
MSARRRIVLAAVPHVILGCALIAPTSAHAERSAGDSGDSAETAVVFEVKATGGLSISAPAAATLTHTVPGGTSRGSIGEVEVVDERAVSDAQWTAVVSLSRAFSTGEGHWHQTIPGSRVRYDPGEAIDPVNGPFVPGLPGSLADSRAAFRHPTGSGSNSVAWDPTLEVHVPTLVVAGTYRGVVTHSVA